MALHLAPLSLVTALAVVCASASSALSQSVRNASQPQRIAATIALPVRSPDKPESDNKIVHGPTQIIVSIPDQKLEVYAGTERIASSRVSTGKSGHATPEGVFSILEKNRQHYSNIYGGAPMPFMQRLTWTGIALHASGSVPGYPASHGCIRLPHSFAKTLFDLTKTGAHVIVNRGLHSPVVFEHEALFQPRLRPAKSQAAAIKAITLDGLQGAVESRWDRRALLDKKAGQFVAALRYAHDPNPGSHRRATIRLVQKLLGFLGYEIERVDGDLGPKTRGVIRAFQKDYGIRVDGQLSDRLTTALYWALGRQMVTMPDADADELLTPAGIDKPLRILITRAEEYDDVKRAQRLLEQMGYYIGAIDGALGRWTRYAIKQFREKSGLPRNKEVDEELLDALALAVREANGVGAEGGDATAEAATGHIYVRQGARDIYDAPVTIKDLKQPLGTHVFTAMDFGEKRDTKVVWTALPVAERRSSADDPSAILDRIAVPAPVRIHIEQMLTPGSSLIVSDHGISHETGEGTDFVVLTK